MKKVSRQGEGDGDGVLGAEDQLKDGHQAWLRG